MYVLDALAIVLLKQLIMAACCHRSVLTGAAGDHPTATHEATQQGEKPSHRKLSHVDIEGR